MMKHYPHAQTGAKRPAWSNEEAIFNIDKDP